MGVNNDPIPLLGSAENGKKFALERSLTLQTNLHNALIASETLVSNDAEKWARSRGGDLKDNFGVDMTIAAEPTPFSAEYAGFRMVLHRHYGRKGAPAETFEPVPVAQCLEGNTVNLHSVLYSRDQERGMVINLDRVDDLKGQLLQNQSELPYKFEIELRKRPSNLAGVVDETELHFKNIVHDGESIDVEVAVDLGFVNEFDANLHEATRLEDEGVADLGGSDPEAGVIELPGNSGIYIEVGSATGYEGGLPLDDPKIEQKLLCGMNLTLYAYEFLSGQRNLSMRDRSAEEILGMQGEAIPWFEELYSES